MPSPTPPGEEKHRSRNAIVSCPAPSLATARSLGAEPLGVFPRSLPSSQAQKAQRERKAVYVKSLEDKIRLLEGNTVAGPSSAPAAEVAVPVEAPMPPAPPPAPARAANEARLAQLAAENAQLKDSVSQLQTLVTLLANQPASPSTSTSSPPSPPPDAGAGSLLNPLSTEPAYLRDLQHFASLYPLRAYFPPSTPHYYSTLLG